MAARETTGCNASMHILHVISTLAPTSGGPTSALRGLANCQHERGHRVAVCTTNTGNPTSITLDKNDIFQGYVPGIERLAFSAQASVLLVSRGMRAWLHRRIREFDVVHIHGLYRFPPTYAARCARKRGIPYIIRPHGSLDPYLYKQSSQSVLLKRMYERWFDWPNLNAAGAIHYTTEDERAGAAALGFRAPTFVVPNGLDWARFASLPARGAFRARLGVGEVPLVLFLSRVNFKKGLDLLVPAFAVARATFPDAVLAIVGPDNEGYGAKVRGWVAERGLQRCVRFVDALAGSAVLEAYVDADAFALPSYTENFGIVVAEAMACQCPVVISDQVNIHGEVASAGAGLVTRCDATEVANALIALLGDGDRRRAMGARGRELVRRKWTWDAVAGQLEAEYSRVIARSKGLAMK